MDQNVGAVHGDNHAFHNELRRSLVHLVSFQPGNEKPFSVAAIPIVSVNGFCYMISHSKVFRQQDAANWQHRVIFPDEIIVMLRIEDVIIQGSLAAFSVNTTAELPNPVKFSEQQVSHNQEVHTVNFEGVMEPSLLVRGRKTQGEKDCSGEPCWLLNKVAGEMFNTKFGWRFGSWDSQDWN
uniref:Uncharacterized protein n=1 Tax=Oryza nivara TaxID=4536 RepID=A0A0E0I5D1_ORYNI